MEHTTNAIIDGDGVVKNLIVVEKDWNLGGIPIGDLIVNIGDQYNFIDKKFYHVDGTPCQTEAEIQAEIEKNIAEGAIAMADNSAVTK